MILSCRWGSPASAAGLAHTAHDSHFMYRDLFMRATVLARGRAYASTKPVCGRLVERGVARVCVPLRAALRRGHARRWSSCSALCGRRLGAPRLRSLVALCVNLLEEGRVLENVRKDHEAHVAAAQEAVGEHLHPAILHRLGHIA